MKYAIDFITLVSFAVTAVTGLALKFFMPSGVRRAGLQEFLGVAKNGWVEVHEIAGILMIIFALIHVIMYWKMFTCMTKNFFNKNKEQCEIKTSDTKE